MTDRDPVEGVGSAVITGSLHDAESIDGAVAFRIHRTNRLLITHLARFLRSEGGELGAEQWFVLARLDEAKRAGEGPLPQSALSERALVDAPNVSRLVDALVERGLVERTPSATDRRVKLIEVTDAGSALAGRLLAAAQHERHRVFAGIDDDELQRLLAVLDLVDDNVRGLLEP